MQDEFIKVLPLAGQPNYLLLPEWLTKPNGPGSGAGRQEGEADMLDTSNTAGSVADMTKSSSEESSAGSESESSSSSIEEDARFAFEPLQGLLEHL